MEKTRRQLLDSNLSLLKEVDNLLYERVKGVTPSDRYEVFCSKKGKPSLKIDDLLFHSSYDPEEEAKCWVDKQMDSWNGCSTPLVFGLGLGYHIIELCKKIDHEIIVLEPDLNVFRLALEFIDLSELINRSGFVVEQSIEGLDCILKGRYLLMPHTPTRNRYQDLYSALKRRLKRSERFKILVVSPVYGGSLPIAYYSSSALRSLGYEVELLDMSVFDSAFLSINGFVTRDEDEAKLKGLFTIFLSEVVMARVVEFKPDLVFALAQAPLTGDILKRLKGYRIPTAFWFVEDFRVLDYWKDVAPHYDYFFAIQDGEFFDILRSMGLKNIHLLPPAASPEIHKPLNLDKDEIEEYGSDLSFVGAGYPNRRNVFKRLIDHDFKIWGDGWDGAESLYHLVQRDGKRISTEDSVKVFNATKININLHSSKQHEEINPYGDFVNPRTFEIASCGAFQLTDHRSQLPRFFDIDREIICFKDTEEMIDKIAYFLKRTKEREDIASRARERVLKEHTYTKRLSEMMDFLIDRGFEGADSIPRRWKVDDLLIEAGRGSELWGYLSRFIDRRTIELPEIVKDIHMGEGALTRPEAIFLIMNEIYNKEG